MNEGRTNTKDLLDTTDCLEAVGVFRGWKNFLFVIVICCLLLLQTSFWLIDTGCIKTEDKGKAVETVLSIIEPPPVITPPVVITPPPADKLAVPLEEKQTGQPAETLNKIEKAAEQVTESPNQPGKAALPALQQTQQQKTSPGSGIKIKVGQLTFAVRFFNFVLIPAAALYCLTILFSLKVSLLGRLGGINHICRAFFLSLAFLVLLLPWQKFFAGVIVGAMYTPEELLSSYAAADDSGIFGAALYYLRFTGFWLLVMLLLILSQLRSGRWAKAILRRLEVI